MLRSVQSLRQQRGLSPVWSRAGARQVRSDRTCARFWGAVPEPLPAPRIVGLPLPFCVTSQQQKTHKKPKTPPNPLFCFSWVPPPLSLMSFEQSRDCKGNSSQSHIKAERFVQFDFISISSRPLSRAGGLGQGCPAPPAPSSPSLPWKMRF